MWVMRNKRSGTSQQVTDDEKAYWQSTHFAKSLTFTEVPTLPRATRPEAVRQTTLEPTKEPKPKRKRKQPEAK